MTAHVAEASEDSGRVLLWLDSGPRASEEALKAFVRLASAYHSEIETVDVAPAPPWQFEGLPTATIHSRYVASDAGIDYHRAHAHLVRMQRSRMNELAQSFDVPMRHATVSGDPVDQLASMCQQRGPWNIIALSRAPGPDLARLTGTLFANVSGATAILVGGRRVKPWAGRVAVVAEDCERLPSMLRAGRRIAGPHGSVHLIISAATESAYRELEEHARLVGDNEGSVVVESTGPTFGVGSALDARFVEAEASMVIARFGGMLLSDGRALTRALTVSTAPFLLVR